MQNVVTAVPADAENAGGTEEWPAGFPIAGFRNLFRLAFIASLLALPNLAFQIYLTTAIHSTSLYGYDTTPASSVWACVVGLAGSVHILWVSYRGLHKVPGMKGHLVIAIITSFITSVFLITGTGMTATTAGHTNSLSRSVVGECFYFNQTYTQPRYSYDPNYTRPDGVCYDCDSNSNGGGYSYVQRSTCCCCIQNFYSYGSSGSSVKLFGVSDCGSVKDAVYPVSTLSATLYGICFLLMSICFVLGCIVACQCYCCSINCGPFPTPAQRTYNRQMMRVYPQPQPNVAGFPPQNGAGLPQQTAGFTAMPVSASVGASGPHPPYVMAVPAAQSIAQDPAVAEGLASPQHMDMPPDYKPDVEKN